MSPINPTKKVVEDKNADKIEVSLSKFKVQPTKQRGIVEPDNVHRRRSPRVNDNMDVVLMRKLHRSFLDEQIKEHKHLRQQESEEKKQDLMEAQRTHKNYERQNEELKKQRIERKKKEYHIRTDDLKYASSRLTSNKMNEKEEDVSMVQQWMT